MNILRNKRIDHVYPQEGISRRIMLGTLFNGLGEIVSSLKYIIIVPLFLKTWGNMIYGEWLTIFAFISYLPMIDVGMQHYIVNLLTKSYSKGNIEEHTRIFQSALQLFILIITISLFFLLIFVFMAPFTDWLNIEISDNHMVRITTLILGIYLLLSLVLGLISGLYDNMGEYPRRKALYNIYQIISLILLAITLFLRGNFIHVSLAYLISLILFILLIIYDIKQRHPEIVFGLANADFKSSLKYFGPGILFLLITLSYSLRIQGASIIIGSILGSAYVTTFSIHRTLANMISKLSGIIRSAIWPEITAIDATNKHHKLHIAHNLIFKISMFFTFSLVITLFFTGKKIISIWTSDSVGFSQNLWLLLLITVLINVYWETSAIFQVSTNKHSKYAFIRISSSILGIIFAILFTRLWGITGTLIGFLLTESLICGIFVPLITLKIIGIAKKTFLVNILAKGIIVFTIQFVIGIFLMALFINTSFIVQSILVFIGIFVAGGYLSYIFWLNTEERSIINNLITKSFKYFQLLSITKHYINN